MLHPDIIIYSSYNQTSRICLSLSVHWWTLLCHSKFLTCLAISPCNILAHLPCLYIYIWCMFIKKSQKMTSMIESIYVYSYDPSFYSNPLTLFSPSSLTYSCILSSHFIRGCPFVPNASTMLYLLVYILESHLTFSHSFLTKPHQCAALDPITHCTFHCHSWCTKSVSLLLQCTFIHVRHFSDIHLDIVDTWPLSFISQPVLTCMFTIG